MFLRDKGWIVTPSHVLYISHYFSENQTKALCGAAFVGPSHVHDKPHSSFPVCRRCTKYLSNHPLTAIKNIS